MAEFSPQDFIFTLKKCNNKKKKQDKIITNNISSKKYELLGENIEAVFTRRRNLKRRLSDSGRLPSQFLLPCGELNSEKRICKSKMPRSANNDLLVPLVSRGIANTDDTEALVSNTELEISIKCRIQTPKKKVNWGDLPTEALVQVFSHLPVLELGKMARVCRTWYRVAQYSELWQRFEFVLSTTSKSYVEPTSPELINFVLKHHAKHLKFVVFKTDSSIESAQTACHILSKLVNCSLKTLALISSASPVFLDVDQQSFVSALTLVLDHSRALSSLAIDNTPVDDPSLKALANSNSRTLELLRMKSCPKVSPGGILALADHCRCLRELSLSYTLLSDELLIALSSEKHVKLESFRIDVYTEKDMQLQRISPRCWQALVEHSPNMNLIMHIFMLPEESFENLFISYTPVTHLYFGDCLPKKVLARIGKHCPRLQELVVGAIGNTLLDNELLTVASNCPHLTSLGLGECEVSCSAFVEMVRRCGPRLAQLSVMEECLVEDTNYDLNKTCKKVSEILGREWYPEFMPVW